MVASHAFILVHKARQCILNRRKEEHLIMAVFQLAGTGRSSGKDSWNDLSVEYDVIVGCHDNALINA